MKKVIKIIKIGIKVVKIITIVYPVIKGIVKGIIAEYKNNIDGIKKIWASK